jgi:hypothetical protein
MLTGDDELGIGELGLETDGAVGRSPSRAGRPDAMRRRA